MANKNNNKSIDVSYVFPETISKKSGDLYSKFSGIDELTIYEEPRWSFEDHLNNEVMNYLKENENDLYEEIIEYQKEHPDGFYFDVGKSLRYDDLLFWWQGGDCSLETLEDKLDDLFFIRYSAEGLDGNLGNPDEIHIRDEKLVSKLNSMIKEHVQNNIDRYNEYKKIRSELVDKELVDKHNNALDVYYEEDLKAYTDYAPLPEKTNPENQIIRVQKGQLTTELEVLLDLNKEGDLIHNFGWFKYAELDKNGVLVKDYPVGIWDQRQDEKGNPLNPPKIDSKDISQVIFSKELREKIDSNLKKKIDEVSQTLMRENFENNIHNGNFTDFNAGKVVESMKNETFKEFEAIGSFEAGNCSFNLWITKGGVPEEPWIDISPVRTIGGTDINGTVSLSLSDIMEPTETLSIEEQIKNTILRKIDELDSPEDTQKTIITVLGKNYDELNKNKNWVWKDYDDLSGHLESPDGKSYFSYDWTTKEYKTTPESSWDSFIDADPTRDTSLSAFKKYAEKFVRNNIAKDNDIVFERKYIDTSKEMEGETMSNETLADKYNRMNKLFEERKSREGSGNPLTFEELYKWTEKEFPEKDSSEVLRETVGRMIMDNVSHEEFNVEYYDDVYGFGDGADFRWDLSFKAADALLSGDALTFSEAQELIYKESNKMFEELKQNPNYKNEIELTDRINAAFRISKNLYPDFAKLYEHDVPEDGFYNYTKADKKAYIEKAWETIQKEYGNTLAHHRVADLRTDGIDLESEYRKVTGEILTADLVSLIKGHDVVFYGEESLNFIRPNKENIELAFENNWSEFDAITKGYSLASSSSIKDAVNIEKIDDMDVFDSDVAAAKQYGIDHNVPIFEEKQTIWIGDDNNEYYSYPDTPENRKVLKDYLIDKPVKEKFDWSEFTEKDFDLLKRNLDNSTERMYGSVHIGSISCDLQYREGNKFDLDFYVLGDEGYGGEIEFDEKSIPYSENAITSLNLDEIKDMSYDQFKDWYQDVLIRNIEEENYTYEARRPTINWSNEEQCQELYRTKLIESARLNEIVIAPYTHDEEHQRDVEVIRQWLSDVSELDAAREQIGKAAKKFGIDIEGSEIPEDAIDDFLEKHPELNRFNESGQMLAEIDSENEILNKPFIPSEYVLNKLQEKGIEVVTDKSKFNELLKASEILQKMEGNKKENLSDKYFQANQSEAEAFSKELDAFIADYDKTQKTINPLKMLNVGSITPVMKLLGIADVPVGIDQSTISKALREEPIYPDDEQGHKLTIDELKNIPQSLADPVMVFRSDSPTRRQRDSYVFFTEQRDFKNRSIIIPVAVNKKYGRLVINKVTSIYGRNEEIRYVKDNIQRGNLVYFDKKRSLEWERECKVQFLAQVLPIEGSINNILSKDSLVKFLDSKSEKMVKDGTTYGFAHNGKIYLNSDVLSAEAAMHEYTHLWDNLTRKENPMLWNKGLEIFKGTSIWNEVINDEHYQDIKDDENLVLSECHARITGKVTETVLNRIAELDGNEKQAEMIEWDKETVEFIFENYRDIFEKNSFSSVAEFTTATMKDLFSPMEQQKQDIAIDSSTFERMEKFFEGKFCDDFKKGDSFAQLYESVKKEFPKERFPTWTNEKVLSNAVSRMIYENINYNLFTPANYDDVYDAPDGYEQRCEIADRLGDVLINDGERFKDFDSLQKALPEFEENLLKELKENNPDMLLTDSINEAFEISKKYNPLAEKNINDYTKSEKTQNIKKALYNIEKTYTEDSHDIRIDYGTGIFGADLEALIKGNDAAIYGEKSLDFIRPDRISLELGIEDDIPFNDLIRGYFVFDSEDLKVPRHIERWDYMEVFDTDYDAAQQWKLETGGKLLENGKDIWISDENLEHFYYPDTPENRIALKEYLLPQPLEFNWDNFTEKQFNAVKEEITSGNIKEDYKGQVYVGSVCAEFTITDKESCWVDYNNYILGEKGEGEISGIPYSYQNGKQVVMNTFTENTYENFKTVIENVLIEDLGKDSHLKQEAMRKTINWSTINENNKEAALQLWKEKEGRNMENTFENLSNEETVKYLKDYFNEKNVSISDDLAEEMFYKHLDNGFELKKTKNDLYFYTVDEETGKTEYVSTHKIVDNVLNWDEKELSELHSGTADVKDIESLKGFVSQLETIKTHFHRIFETFPPVDFKISDFTGISNANSKNVNPSPEVNFTQASDIDIKQKVSEFGYFIKLDAGWLLQDELIGSYAKEIVKDQENNFFVIDRKAEEGSTDELPKPLDKILLESLVSEVVDAIKMRDDEKLDASGRNFDVGFTNAYESLVNFQKELEKVRVTHSVTFPCGFTFPYSVGKTEREQNNYRKKIYKKLQEKYGFGDNDAETGYWPEDDRAEASFNIHFAVLVPEEIKADIEKVNAWIEDVEKFVKEECGCSFIDWQGGEREEQTFVNEKQYKMQQERNNDFAHPNAEDLDYASPKDIKEYCKLNSKIELSDEQVEEIHNFYDNNVQFALYVSPAGNLYERDEYKEELVSADAELLKAGNYLRTLEGKERLDYLLKTHDELETSLDEDWFKSLLNQASNDSDERLRIVSDVLSDSFATLDRHDGFWQLLLDYGADPTRAIRIAAEDANLGDNLNWLLSNVPERHLNQIFSDNGYSDAVFDIAKKSVEHDMDSWHGGEDIGFEGFKRIARLCEREADADRYYGELLEKAFEYPVEPKIVQLLDTPELLAEKMNSSKIYPDEPTISREQASSILNYCNFENIKFYVAKDGGIYSLDVSEDYNGEGLKESNFGIVANGIEYARKAQDLEYSCYSAESFNIVAELWQKERQFANPAIKNRIKNFPGDIDKIVIAKLPAEEYELDLELKDYLKSTLKVDKGIDFDWDDKQNYAFYDMNELNSATFFVLRDKEDNSFCAIRLFNKTYEILDRNIPFDKAQLNAVSRAELESNIEYHDGKAEYIVHDVEKWRKTEQMKDFPKLSKEEFFSSYSYLSEEEYDATAKYLKDNNLTADKVVEQLKAKGEKLSDPIPDYYTDIPAEIEKDNQMKEEPVEIIKKVASEKEAAEVPEKFKTEFRNRMISRTKSPDPFIVARSILKEWQTSKPEYVPVLNEYLRSQGCTTEAGFEKFFKTINAPETKQERKLYNDIIHER